jgi:hypothetical protein
MPPKIAGDNIASETPQIWGVEASNLNETTEDILLNVSKKYGVPYTELLFIAQCESGMNPEVIHTNLDGSIDRGLMQINNRYHPQVSDECSFNVKCSAEYTAKSITDGHIGWWVCSHNFNK